MFRRLNFFSGLSSARALAFGGAALLLPGVARAALVTCWGYQDCQLCSLVALADNIVRYLILLGIPIAAIMFSYAGFLYFTSGGSEENASKAKTIFKDVLIGFIVALLGFTIVDTLLRTLAFGVASGPSWNSIQCVQNRNLDGGLGFSGTPTPAGSVTVGATPNTSAVVLSGDCAAGKLPQPTGAAWTSAQMKTMSCIAQKESTCDPTAQYRGPLNSNATGLYQIIVGGYNNPAHNLNFASCSAAAGVTGNLNCHQAYVAGGFQRFSPLLNDCFKAARNVQCNTDAANYLLQNACSKGNCYSDWAQTSVGC